MRFAVRLCVMLLLAANLFAQNASEGPKKPVMGLDLAALDTTADPCEDFYQYACGGWRKANPIPSDRPRWGRYDEMNERNLYLLRGILEQAADASKPRNAVETQIGDYYGACMDESGIEKKGSAPLQPWFRKIDAIKNREDLVGVIADLHNNGISALFNFYNEPELKNSSMMGATVDQGGLGLPNKDYYVKPDAKFVENRAKYVEHIQKMLELVGDSPEQAAANANTIMKIETALAEPALDPVQRRSPENLDHRMKTDELYKLAPNFAFPLYFEKTGVPKFADLNVAVPEFFKQVNQQLESTSIADWKTYLRWRVTRSAAQWLSSDFVNENFRFNGQYLRGTKQLEPRWKRCVRATDGFFGEPLGKVFVDKHFGKEGKLRMAKLVETIGATIEQNIRTLDWMSEATKKKAVEKLDAIRYDKLGYPEKWIDYSSVKVDRNDLLGNNYRSTQFETRRQLAKIGKPVDKSEWEMTPPTVNAYYSPQLAEIVFPAGMLQPPMFSAEFDDALNFGAVGRVVGHELIHGFDDEGRKFDAQGNLTDWWTEADAKAFEERAACVEEQYSNYVVVKDEKTGEEVKLNGKLTLGENTADIGGVKFSFLAFSTTQQAKEGKKIDGFTPEQRFFLSYAHSRCENLTDQYARLMAASDPHSTGQYRLVGAVSNLPEFWKAFGCKKGQKMVRENACKVW